VLYSIRVNTVAEIDVQFCEVNLCIYHAHECVYVVKSYADVWSCRGRQLTPSWHALWARVSATCHAFRRLPCVDWRHSTMHRVAPECYWWWTRQHTHMQPSTADRFCTLLNCTCIRAPQHGHSDWCCMSLNLHSRITESFCHACNNIMQELSLAVIVNGDMCNFILKTVIYFFMKALTQSNILYYFSLWINTR